MECSQRPATAIKKHTTTQHCTEWRCVPTTDRNRTKRQRITAQQLTDAGEIEHGQVQQRRECHACQEPPVAPRGHPQHGVVHRHGAAHPNPRNSQGSNRTIAPAPEENNNKKTRREARHDDTHMHKISDDENKRGAGKPKKNSKRRMNAHTHIEAKHKR